MGLTLRLLRHGETDWAAQRRYTGHVDVPLNARGRAQAEALRSLNAPSYDSVWSSDLSRCVETAELIGCTSKQTPLLREFDFGQIEGQRWEDLSRELQQRLLRFDGFEAPGGETMTAFASRIDAFLRSLPNGRHLIITHGGVIRLLLRRCGLDRSVPPGTSHDVVIRGSAPPCKGLQTPQRGLSNDAAAEGSFAECTTIPEGHKRSRETPKTGPPRRGGKKMER